LSLESEPGAVAVGLGFNYASGRYYHPTRAAALPGLLPVSDIPDVRAGNNDLIVGVK
jgi:hypothetical protein